MSSGPNAVIEIPPKLFLAVCAVVSFVLVVIGPSHPLPVSWIAAEVFATILALFVLGTIRYRLDKNALTYGAGMVIAASVWGRWWPTSALHLELSTASAEGSSWIVPLMSFFHHHFLTLHGLDDWFHADTMLFILGLTFFVSIIAQTRLLESISFAILKKNRGAVVPTIILLGAMVSLASGILDGVSMIGLLIRTMVIILVLAKVPSSASIFAVVVSTVMTTVCGMWLAYGEPPNLIMKSNLHPLLTDQFFLSYCLPVAVGCYLIVAFFLSRKLKNKRINMDEMDILDAHSADLRFYQAKRHGAVYTPLELVEENGDELGKNHKDVLSHLHKGESLGVALCRAGVPEKTRHKLLSIFVSEEAAETVDKHYRHLSEGKPAETHRSFAALSSLLERVRKERVTAQKVGGLAFIPFVGLLITHGVNHNVPLFLASFAGFAVALGAVWRYPRMRGLAFHEAWHEYKEYFFLLPLFFSIGLLQKTGFFGQLAEALHHGIDRFGASHMASVQFLGATFLSALLDNNVVADFAARALHGLSVALIHFFAMAQIAGYAIGGCWTHVGSAQSVVAYAFIQKEIDEHYTPIDWIKSITPMILALCAFTLIFVYVFGAIFLVG